MPGTRRSGRRAGDSGTREAIADAARRAFAASGYDRATIRGIAADAGVDPALVGHFFGSKQRLFVATMAFPVRAEEILPQIVAGDRAETGDRFVRAVVGRLDDPEVRRVIVGLVRAAASEPEAAQMLREVVTDRVLGPIAEALGAEDAELRAGLVGSQMVGLVMARYVVGVEPLASATSETIVRALGPTVQRYLLGELSTPPRLPSPG